MTKVIANMSMSLDGFVAEPSDGVGPLFDWYNTGPVDVTMPGDHEARHVRMSQASADHLTETLESLGALVSGRRLFDYTKGWDGEHPAGVPVVVVTHEAPTDWPHPDAPFTFVTDGVPSAIARAKEIAGDKVVVIASPTIAQQALDAGLLDELSIDLVPVLFGEGIRFFGELADGHVMLENPDVVVGDRVTHLTFKVRRG